MMPYLGLRRGSADNPAIMKQIRKPKFVDNALHLGEFSGHTGNQSKVTIRQRKKATYGIATERGYLLTELEDSILLKQPQTHGRNYSGSIVYMGSSIKNNAALNKPVLLYAKGAPFQRLRTSSVTESLTGTKFAIKNTRDSSLATLGFEKTQVHFGQPLDVGLRTTDLALRLSRDIADTLTSVNIALPITPKDSEIDRRSHSFSFVATNFNGITLIDALRFISRHDNRVVQFDRFGNLAYVPFQFELGSRFVNHNTRTGPAISNPIENISNRVIVEGTATAVNDTAYAEVNNSEKQSGGSGEILEEPQVIGDFTVRSNEQAREVGRNVLKANSVMLGNLTSAGHPNCFDLRPGMTIEYNGQRKMLVEVRHRLASATSDLVFLSVETGIEGVMQGILDGTKNAGRQVETVQQIVEKNMALFGDVEIVSMVMTEIRGHGSPGDGFIIGKGMGRGMVGIASGELVGGSKTRAFSDRGD